MLVCRVYRTIHKPRRRLLRHPELHLRFEFHPVGSFQAASFMKDFTQRVGLPTRHAAPPLLSRKWRSDNRVHLYVYTRPYPKNWYSA